MTDHFQDLADLSNNVVYRVKCRNGTVEIIIEPEDRSHFDRLLTNAENMTSDEVLEIVASFYDIEY